VFQKLDVFSAADGCIYSVPHECGKQMFIHLVFNKLPFAIEQLSRDTNQFKMALKVFSPILFTVGPIFQIQYELNFKVVYVTCIS
jgi:hypothetical protein